MNEARIYVLHENDEWFAPLSVALTRAGLPFESWNMKSGVIDLQTEPPKGVFFSRMSASAHTRGHLHAPDFTACVLAWLERHGRRVINGSAALRLELSKVAQYALLEDFGLTVPHTLAVCGKEEILKAAASFSGPFITKHNRSGKGLGVRLFHSVAELADHLDGPDYIPPVDGILLLQEYIQAPQPYITRLEFIAGNFVYALRADTSEGFELCPQCSADSCAISTVVDKFTIVEEEVPDLDRYQALLRHAHIEVGAVEFILDKSGHSYTYDINTNTNYNAAAEAKAGVSAMERLATFLGGELTRFG